MNSSYTYEYVDIELFSFKTHRHVYYMYTLYVDRYKIIHLLDRAKMVPKSLQRERVSLYVRLAMWPEHFCWKLNTNITVMPFLKWSYVSYSLHYDYLTMSHSCKN